MPTPSSHPNRHTHSCKLHVELNFEYLAQDIIRYNCLAVSQCYQNFRFLDLVGLFETLNVIIADFAAFVI